MSHDTPAKEPGQSPARHDAAPGVPGFRTWRGVYTFVFVSFAITVALLALFTRAFR